MHGRTREGARWLSRPQVLVGAALVAAVAMLLPGLLAPPSVAAHRTIVSGVVSCDEATGVYTVAWSATNSEGDKTIVALTATLSGADTGNVAMAPIPVPASGTAMGESMHAGSTAGTLTLTVDATWDNGVMRTNSGSVELAGDCLPPPQTCEAASAAGLIGEPSNARKVTLCHFTGSDTNPVVINEVALASATSHFSHHEDLWNCGAVADVNNPAFCAAGIGYPSP